MKFYLIQFGGYSIDGERNRPFGFRLVSSINTGLKLLEDNGFVESKYEDEPVLHKEDNIWIKENFGAIYWASFHKYDADGNVSALPVDDQRSFP